MTQSKQNQGNDIASSPLLAAVSVLSKTADEYDAMADVLEENGNPDPSLVADLRCWSAEIRETLDEVAKEHE